MNSLTRLPLSLTLPPTLMPRHREILEWLSCSAEWKNELTFFQELLDQYAEKFSSQEDKKKIEHFQCVILYYKFELIDVHRSRLKQHQKRLASILEASDPARKEYYRQYESLISDLEALKDQFDDYKNDLFTFVTRVM